MKREQTAVDFYDQQLHILDLRLKSGSITIGEYFTLKSELFAQSKQMEKEQIMSANSCGFSDGINHEKDIPVNFISCEQYYNETYKQ